LEKRKTRFVSPKISIFEKDSTDTYRPVSLEQFLQMVKDFGAIVKIVVPNACGGESIIEIHKDVCGKR